MPDIPDFSAKERLRREKETIGVYVTGHPMDDYRDVFEALCCDSIAALNRAGEQETGAYQDNSKVRIFGIVTSLKKKNVRANQTMAFLTVEDMNGEIEVLVFAATLERYGALIREDEPILLRGRLSLREDSDAKVVCEQIERIPTAEQLTQRDPSPDRSSLEPVHKSHTRNGLFLRVDALDAAPARQAKKILRIFDGEEPVYYFTPDGGYVRAPRSEWVSVNEPMLRELQAILGKANVVYRPPESGRI